MDIKFVPLWLVQNCFQSCFCYKVYSVFKITENRTEKFLTQIPVRTNTKWIIYAFPIFSLLENTYISQRVFCRQQKSYKSHIRSCINKIQQSLLWLAHRRPLKKLIICESLDLIYKSWISWSDAFREELLSGEFIPSILPHKTYFHWIKLLKHLCRNYPHYHRLVVKSWNSKNRN